MVPATKRELSSASVVVWAELVRVCAGVLRPGPELRPERGFESSGRIRVSAYASSSDEPQEGHDSPSTAISDVQVGHLIGRRMASLKKGLTRALSNSRHAPRYAEPRRNV